MREKTDRERADQRRNAQARLSDPSWNQYAHEVTRCQAVVAALDWLDGDTPLAPVSRRELEPNATTVRQERMRAFDAEDQGGGTFAGAVAHTLSWQLGFERAEAPVLTA